MAIDFAPIGRALSSPARSAMVDLLMDGSSRPAAELADVAEVSASTASEHLAVLVEAGILIVRSRGRQRLFELADLQVAEALEHLGRLCPTTSVASLRRSREQRDLARARLCYDHLAGRLGVGIVDAWSAAGWLAGPDLELSGPGADAITRWGLDVPGLVSGRRPLTRACPDWTERRAHLAGALGAALTARVIERGWVRRRTSGRGLDVTSEGEAALTSGWGVQLDPPDRTDRTAPTPPTPVRAR